MSVLRYFIKFSYNGTLYRGAAKQSKRDSVHDIDTVQGVLETAFLSLQPPPRITTIRLTSRTDSGVHALYAVATVSIETRANIQYCKDYLVQRVNCFLMRTKNSIRLLECVPVTQGWSVRDIIRSRTYIYRFMIAKEFGDHRIPMMEWQHTLLIRSETFDIERMEQAMQLFMGRKNFMTFAAQKRTVIPIRFERTLNELRLEKAHPLSPFDLLSDNFNYWHVICSAKSFLYNQVRRITGALFALAAGRITERDINIMLTVPSHSNWDPRVVPSPAHGLYLAKTEYDESLLNTYAIKDIINGTPSKKKRIAPLVANSQVQ